MDIILASASPRRKELLEQMGLEFRICPSDKEEPKEGLTPEQLVVYLSSQKAQDIASAYEECIVIGADTIVVADGEILGKPESKEEAKEMLCKIEGKSHRVYTGVTVIKKVKTEQFHKSFAEETEVSVYSMTEREIMDYIQTKEPMDKAGAYGIQGRFGIFIKEIRGDYNNVVGLPIARLYQELKKIL